MTPQEIDWSPPIENERSPVDPDAVSRLLVEGSGRLEKASVAVWSAEQDEADCVFRSKWERMEAMLRDELVLREELLATAWLRIARVNARAAAGCSSKALQTARQVTFDLLTALSERRHRLGPTHRGG